MIMSKLFFQSTKSNASQVTIQLLKLFNIAVTRSTIIDTIEGHPDHPSLVSISDSLKRWKVNNMALQVNKDKLDALPVPFLAHVKEGRDSFEVVTQVDAFQVRYQSADGKIRLKEKERFMEEWSGVVLLIEPGAESGEKHFKHRHRSEMLKHIRLPFIFLSSLLLYFFFVILNFRQSDQLYFLSPLLLLTKLAGTIVSGLLLWYEVDKSNTSLKKICKGKNTNCDAVLGSKQAKLFNWIGWSEIGFFYFAGGFLFLFFSPGDLYSSFAFLSLMSLLALPYTFFSVYYQWKIVKKWCRLCLIVQGILVSEFLITYFAYRIFNFYPFFNLSNFLSLLLAFGIPVFFWSFTKTYLVKGRLFDDYKNTLSRIKHNPDIFNALLPKQKPVINATNNVGILLGNPLADNTVIKVSNPFCPACGQAHFFLNELLENNPNVKVQVIFTIKDDGDNPKSMLIKHFMALYAKKSIDIIKVLDYWYRLDRKNYTALAKQYPVDEESLRNGDKLTAMSNWCEQNTISFTPTFFLNGFQLPEIYGADDIAYFLT